VGGFVTQTEEAFIAILTQSSKKDFFLNVKGDGFSIYIFSNGVFSVCKYWDSPSENAVFSF